MYFCKNVTLLPPICKSNAGLGIRSFQKNVPIFAFFSVLYKRTERSLPSFLFFIKERSDLCVLFRFYIRTERSFWFHKSNKHWKSLKKKNSPFFFRYIQYLYVYVYIHLYISIYIMKKERNVLAFFSVLWNRTLRSLRSFWVS